MKKILLLTGKDNITFYGINNTDICCEEADFYNNSKFIKIFRRNNLLVKYALADWKKHILDYDIIICIDSVLTMSTIKWLDKNKGTTKVILYFRNKFDNAVWDLKKLKCTDIEIWSYNKHDCEKYGFRYNSQVLSKKFLENVQNLKKYEIKYSLTFIGENKNRHELLSHIQKSMEQNGKETFFYVINDKALSNNKCTDNRYMEYSDYLKYVCESEAVLDIVSDENYGLTFRPIEALFMKKKLITNYEEIKEYNFFNESNIFILGEKSDKDLEGFLDKPYVDVDEEIVMSYDVNAWIRRFIL